MHFIRSRPLFRDVPIVYVPENAPANAGPVLAEYLEDYENVLTMQEWTGFGEVPTFGVPPTDRTTQTEHLSLALATGGLSYSEDMQVHPSMKLDEYRDGLERQAMCWERIPEVSKDPTKPVKWRWTAKHRAGNDDRIVSLLMLAYVYVFFTAFLI